MVYFVIKKIKYLVLEFLTIRRLPPIPPRIFPAFRLLFLQQVIESKYMYIESEWQTAMAVAELAKKVPTNKGGNKKRKKMWEFLFIIQNRYNKKNIPD